jgi:hypothetical protein
MRHDGLWKLFKSPPFVFVERGFFVAPVVQLGGAKQRAVETLRDPAAAKYSSRKISCFVMAGRFVLLAAFIRRHLLICCAVNLLVADLLFGCKAKAYRAGSGDSAAWRRNLRFRYTNAFATGIRTEKTKARVGPD